MFSNLGKVKMTHIPYKGAGPALTDLLGSQVDMMFATASAVAGFVDSGKLRAIAVTSSERSGSFKNVPTVGETIAGYSVESWYAVYAPAGTPSAVIDKLNAGAKRVIQSAEFRKKIEPEGLITSPGTPEELDVYVHKEEQKWRKIVLENGIKID
jgi:tripartite-type tricarboxylate transporter receptor subunit TctC